MAEKEKDHEANLGSSGAFFDDFIKKKQKEIDKLKEHQSSEHSTQLTKALLDAAIRALEDQKKEAEPSLQFFKLQEEGEKNIKKSAKRTFSMKKKVKLAFLIKPSNFLINSALSNLAIEIGDETKGKAVKDVSNNKKLKKDEGSWDFVDIKEVLFYSRAHCNIEELNEKMSKLINRGYQIHGLEARMYAVLQDNDESNFKIGEDEMKKSFFEWLKEIDRSDHEWDILNGIKTVAAYYGVKLTWLLVDLMLLTSDPETEQAMNKFRVLKTALKWVIEGEKSIVVHRILAVLDWVDSETRKKKEAKEEDKGKAEVIEITEGLEEDISDKTILLLLNIILRMEFFWMHRRLPCSKKSLTNVYMSMEYELDKCQLGLKAIESDIREMKELSAFGFEKEEDHYTKVKGNALFWNIDELWDHIEDSELKWI